jgi:hypothetical protein
VEPFEQIRREFEFGVGTIAGVSRKLGVHRRMVREALRSAEPAASKPQRRRLRKLDVVSEFIDQISADQVPGLMEDLMVETPERSGMVCSWPCCCCSRQSSSSSGDMRESTLWCGGPWHGRRDRARSSGAAAPARGAAPAATMLVALEDQLA